jgi:hypothetical protein
VGLHVGQGMAKSHFFLMIFKEKLGSFLLIPAHVGSRFCLFFSSLILFEFCSLVSF